MNVVPILRSGLSMVDAVTSLLPFPVPVNHLGMYREKSTLQPVEYYNNLQDHRPAFGAPEGEGPVELAIVVDPIIATGATATAAVETLREWGVKKVLVLSILSTVSGLKNVVAECGDIVEIWSGGCDEDTDGKGMIKPGVGDIGDRLYLTMGK
jgi:uracil phosphoribosyltransferase